jgi:hypothetical protein
VLFFAIIQVGDDIARHINQKYAPDAVINEILL